MKQFIIQLAFLCFACVYSLHGIAQQTNTLYFLKNTTLRHQLNPAYEPLNDFYLSLPFIGYSGFNIGNNSHTFKNIVYKENGNTVTFLNSTSSIDQFYSRLSLNTVLRANLHTNLIGFGFRYQSVYWTFSLMEKFNGTLSLPKDVFQLSLYGTPNLLNNSFNLTTLQTDFSAYTEAAFGFAKEMNKEWSVGGKLKLLLGNANLSNTNKKVTFDAGISDWKLFANGSVNYSTPVQLSLSSDLQSLTYLYPTSLYEWFKPTGLGAGVDFGVKYKLNENMIFSASMLDFGFICWNKNAMNLNYSVDYTYDGIAHLSTNSSLNTYNDVLEKLVYGNLFLDSIKSAFNGSATSTQTNDVYTTGTTAKLNLAIEYDLFNHFIGLGILSHSQFYNKTLTNEITTSVQLRPADWLNGALSYSLVNGTWSTFGAGLSLSVGFVNCFVSADYIPFHKVTLPLTDIYSQLPAWNFPVPYNSRVFNLSVGLNFVFDTQTSKYKSGVGVRNKNFVKSGDGYLFKSKKGLQPSKSHKDCRCE